MAGGRIYSKADTDFLTSNYGKMPNEELCEKLGRSCTSIKVKMCYMVASGLYIKNVKPNIYDKAIKTADTILKIRKQIESSNYLNLIINNSAEKVKVLNFSNSYFTVQRTNYRESYQYTDLLLGNIKIVS